MSMSANTSLHLPEYHAFMDSISALALPISSSELHGTMCAYVCAGALAEGEAYLRALMSSQAKIDTRSIASALFGVFVISQQQIVSLHFDFELLLPDDDAPLPLRAQAFSEWCEGFTQGLGMMGIGYDELQEEESQEALLHLTEFAQLDCQRLNVDEDDERALMEVSEYARMAVLRLYSDLQSNQLEHGSSETAH
jgi:uncharacterized protein YgfB (UPF0149 family)